MKLFKILSATLIVFSLFSLNTASAATTPTNGGIRIKLVSTINLRDAIVVNQNGNKFTIHFSISNGSIAQSSLKYGVRLVSGQSVVDEKVYDEVLSFPVDTKIIKDIVYEAPTYLSGDFDLVLVSKAESGLTLAVNSFAKVKLTATSKSVLFSTDSCYLKVKGETADKKYTLVQGVDVLPSESLSLDCLIENNTDVSQTISPSFVTYYRSNYGNVVETPELAPASIVLKKGEKKTVSIEIPKPVKPQAYDVVVKLKNSEITSNSVRAHYVLRGQSASIQNVSLDKNVYKKGEVAKALIVWSPSADSFAGSRIDTEDAKDYAISMLITNEKGDNCAEEYKSLVSTKEKTLEIPISITKYSCINPIVKTTISDKNGNILDERTMNFVSPVTPKNNNLYYIIVIILLVAVVLVIYYIKKKKNSNGSNMITPDSNIPMAILFFFFILISFVLPHSKVNAEGFTVYNDIADTDDLNVTVSLDQSTYVSSEVMYPSGQMEALNCLNDYGPSMTIDVTIKLVVDNGASGGDADMVTLINETDSVNNLGSSFSGNGMMNAPGVNGGYNAQFTGTISSTAGSGSGYVTIPYTVNGAPTVDISSDKATVSSGGKVNISWNSTNATWCTCTFSPPDKYDENDCGYDFGPNSQSTRNPMALTETTTFTVNCGN